ncbi:PAS domain-containing sensor histidine kinase [Hippea jasoniae]|uniref:PAS domain-containing sensor histidine kinase n=1 Tax=Hippea jasoniae TaxID=944479 RepID=UPI00068E237D|nr:ATP-binding protein [Hippea jasoniae]
MKRLIALFNILLAIEIILISVSGFFLYSEIKKASESSSRHLLFTTKNILLHSKHFKPLKQVGSVKIEFLKKPQETGFFERNNTAYLIFKRGKEYIRLSYTFHLNKFVEDILNLLGLLFALFTFLSLFVSYLISVQSDKVFKYINEIIKNIKNDKKPEFPKFKDKNLIRLFYGIKEIYKTLQKRNQQINQQKERLNHIINSMSDGLLFLKNGNIELFNPKIEEFIGVELKDGLNLLDCCQSVETIEFCEKLLENRTETFEYKLSNMWLFVNKQQVLDGLLIVVSDITEQKEYASIKAKFFADASHELKTPITSILGYSETILDSEMDNDTLKKFLKYINVNAQHLAELIEDILMLHRLETTRTKEVKSCDVDIVKEELGVSFSKFASEKGIEFIINCDVDKAPIPCGYLKSILFNLVDNAIKYTEKGFVKVECFIENNQFTIEVSDSGAGIQKQHINRIFERFYTTHKGRDRMLSGTGLGLAIVKHIVELYGGDIEVESEVGKGSRFKITLPSLT